MEISIGDYLTSIESVNSDIRKNRVISRVWEKDYRLWSSEPAEISNRLGWLDLPETMLSQIDSLIAFAGEIKKSGFRHIVLLGMGGSSLGAEVLNQTYGSTAGYPELFVLDSTVPASIITVTEAIDPQHTLFIVSSKSGTTTETNLLFSYFEDIVISAVGKKCAGDHFIAITDPETPLAILAAKKNSRKTFFTPRDIGGRYSILSFFGLVSAALTGIDAASILRRAGEMRSQAECSNLDNNEAARLGVILGSMAQQGRDKFTLVTSPGISSFGLWVEQLLAESTGKNGTGIIPVIGEPLLGPDSYGNDRIFVYLRLQGDANSFTDEAVRKVKNAGQPVVIIDLHDVLDLGAEFFRWEFATAIAGQILKVNPFNQPDVEATKTATKEILKQTIESGNPPDITLSLSPSDLLNGIMSGDYLAILAYVPRSEKMDGAISSFRKKIAEKYHIATTLGYGPRYLHSTGQLHKGGPRSGLFLQIITEYKNDLRIPGESYTFGTLAEAQAAGDLITLQSRGRRIARLLINGDISGDTLLDLIP